MSQNTHMISKSWIALVTALGLVVASAEEPKAEPNPAHILEGARLAATLVKLEGGLEGTLRKGRAKTPVTLFLKGQNIQFQFSENKQPWKVFHMRLGDRKCELFEFVNRKQRAFDKNKLVQPIAGSDLTYEDLAMGFFYWPNPELKGIEKVSGEECYRIRVEKPAGAAGNYESMDIWVHVKYGAFMRIRGYNAKGSLIKEFQVEDVMKVDKDTWTLEKMQVSSYDPKNGRRSSFSELKFDKPKAAKPRGGLR